MCYNILEIENAGMAELADAQDLGSCEAIRVGSTPTMYQTLPSAPLMPLPTDAEMCMR